MLTVVVLFFAALFFAAQSQAREITDMFKKKVSAPDHPRKVYGASPPVTYMLYAIDPSMLVGLNSPLKEQMKRYFRKDINELPILGGWFGQGQSPNIEMLLKINPEIVVASKHDPAIGDKIDTTMKRMPMPTINVTLNTISDYPGAFSYLGQTLGREARGESLASYARGTLSEMAALAASIPVQKRVSVYYAEGVDGLSTECDSSLHAELITLAGGRNVHSCRAGSLYGMEKISLEHLLLYDPEVILVMEKTFYERVFSDPRWHRIKALRNKRVYLIPNEPFNWFDRPPSFMRILGLKWLMNTLYPKEYRIDIVKEARTFYQLFLGADVSEQQMRKVIYAD